MLEDVIKFKNSKEWLEFKDYYETSLLKQIDFFRYEDVHTNFIASLLKMDNVYGLSTKPLKLFLELLKLKDQHQLETISVLEDYYITDIEVKTQEPLECGRLDLLVKFRINNEQYIIILENKLFSSEGENQTSKYQQEIESNSTKYEGTKFYIYLSLEDNSNIDISSDKNDYKNYIRITYQDLISYVLEPCSFLEHNSNVSLNISEYLKGFTYLCEYGDQNFMPSIKQCQQLVVSIWNEYSEILEKILDSIDDKDEKYLYCNKFYHSNKKEFRVLYATLLKIENSNGIHKKIKNKIFGTIGEFKNIPYKCKENTKLYLDLLDDMINNTNVIKTLSDLDNLKFSPRSKWKVAVTEEEYQLMDSKQENYRKSEKLILEGKNLYYCYPISRDELKGFVDCVKNKYEKYNDSVYLN